MTMNVEAAPAAAKTKNAAATRQGILVAARRRFAGESYDTVGLRDIAADAGVDVALVSRYFGGKEKLFKEVLVSEPDWLPPSSADELPHLLTKLFMTAEEAEHRNHAERLLVILRSSSSSSAAAAIVREALSRDVLQPLASRLDGEATEERASLALAVWMGVTMLRTIMAVEPMCGHKAALVDAKLALLYKAALSEL